MPQTQLASPIKVMIAEDHIPYRTAIRHFLSGYASINFLATAGNGQELLQQLEHVQADVILLDIHMPVLDGLETLPLIRQQYPGIKVIILSMENHHHMMSHLMNSGATAYLTKSADPELIYQTIRKCMAAA